MIFPHIELAALMMTGLNLYDVLQVSSTATQEEIRANFLRLAKQYHPDKMGYAPMNNQIRDGSLRTSNGMEPHDFIILQRAYETLSDSGSRLVYDAEIKSQNKYSPVAARVGVDDLEYNEDDTAELKYPCRCGDGFYVTKEHISKSNTKEITVPCSSCSFHIVIELR